MTDSDQALIDRLRARLGLTAQGPYAQVVEERVSRALAARGLGSVEAATRFDESCDLAQALIEAVVIGETHFFREPARLQYMVDNAVPEVLAQRPGGHVLRLWSAGCSTGEEPYTLALLLHQAGYGSAAVLGTDVSSAALRHAERGAYGSWSFRGVPPETRERCFNLEQGRLRVAPSIRRQVTFRLLNLVSDPFPGGFDVILCRNVLVYLDVEVQRSVARGFAAALAPGGWLMTAVTDPVLDEDLGFERVRTPAGFLYRQADHAPRSRERAPTRTTRSARPTPTRRPPQVAPPASARRVLVSPNGPARSASTPAHLSEPETIRALIAERDLEEAERRAQKAVAQAPLDPELRYLQAVAAMEAGRLNDALAAADAACYLAPGLAAVHVLLGQAQRAVGDEGRAARSWERARMLLRAADPEETVAFTDETVSRLLGLLGVATQVVGAPAGGPR